MKWVVLAILAFVVLYTGIMLFFRKPGRAYEPYQNAKEQATVARLEAAGYKPVSATLSRPADPSRARAALGSALAEPHEALGGLTSELAETLLDKPILPESFGSVAAPREGNALMPYSVLFACVLDDLQQLLNDTRVYVKEHRVAIVPSFERLDGELLARSKESFVLLTLPAGTLPAGTYEVTLVGARASKQWTVQVH